MSELDDALACELEAFEKDPNLRERIAAVFQPGRIAKGTGGLGGFTWLEEASMADPPAATVTRATPDAPSDPAATKAPNGNNPPVPAPAPPPSKAPAGSNAPAPPAPPSRATEAPPAPRATTPSSARVPAPTERATEGTARIPASSQRATEVPARVPASPRCATEVPSRTTEAPSGTVPASALHATEAPGGTDTAVASAPRATEAPGGTDVAVPRATEAPESRLGITALSSPAPVELSPTVERPPAAHSARIEIHLLDKLVDLVGELVLARNELVGIGGTPAFANVTRTLDLITSELQERVMEIRMQPLATVWNQLPRVVRDVATASRKQVRVEMVGKDIEVDHTILESIAGPLAHLVRNAVDHGIEVPEVRAARGKPRTGTVTLRASREGRDVHLEICDDGAGIDVARLRETALAAGLVAADQMMSERELLRMLFLPGSSTGHGLGVVKTNVDGIGGSVEITSRLGHGTIVKLAIPLTLANVPAIVVAVDRQRYAIPQASLLELVHLDNRVARVEPLHDAPVFRLRDRLLPLVHLGHVLGTSPPRTDRGGHVVVLQAEGTQFGLVVDQICDREEIAVKPIGFELEEHGLYAGATLVGDGVIALVLDVGGLAKYSGVVGVARERAECTPSVAPQAQATAVGTLLVLEVAGSPVAIPVAQVDRLEQLAASQLDRLRHQPVAYARGEILPLVDVAHALGRGSAAASDPLAVLVCRDRGRSVGLVIDKVIGLVEPSAATVPRGAGDTLVIDGRVTELVDIATLAHGLRP